MICKINSIKLTKGESFILPPNATIIAVDELGNVESTCADLDNVEQFECYVGMLSGRLTRGGTHEYHDWDQIVLNGFSINDVYTPFAVPYKNNDKITGPNGTVNSDYFDIWAIMQELKSNLSAIMDEVTSLNIGPNDAVKMNMAFKTIPSIGDNLTLHLVDYANITPAGAPAPYFVKFRKVADVPADELEGVVTCLET